MADFPPEPLPLWEPSTTERAAARGLSIVPTSHEIEASAEGEAAAGGAGEE